MKSQAAPRIAGQIRQGTEQPNRRQNHRREHQPERGLAALGPSRLKGVKIIRQVQGYGVRDPNCTPLRGRVDWSIPPKASRKRHCYKD